MKKLLIILISAASPLLGYTVGIVSAVQAEVGALKDHMTTIVEEISPGGRPYYVGKLHGLDTVITHARMGKVASALAVTELIARHDIDLILFVGVAGAVDPALRVGDVVIAHSLVQHDMDCRPFIPRYAVPLIGVEAFEPPENLAAMAVEAAERFLTVGPPADVASEFSIQHPRATLGMVATGDRVFANKADLAELRERLPGVACVEMEGAAAGQVAYEYSIPILVIRIISDVADENAHRDILRFVSAAAGIYAEGIVKELYTLIKEQQDVRIPTA